MPDIVTNSKARRDYHILETFEAGIVLRGTEVKALRAGKGQIAEARAQRLLPHQLQSLDGSVEHHDMGAALGERERCRT